MDEPLIGQVFCPIGRARYSHRRVVAIHGGRVVYCTGSDSNRTCKLSTWNRWAKKAVPYAARRSIKP